MSLDPAVSTGAGPVVRAPAGSRSRHAGPAVSSRGVLRADARKDCIDDPLRQLAVELATSQQESVIDRAEEELMNQCDVDVWSHLSALDPALEEVADFGEPHRDDL